MDWLAYLDLAQDWVHREEEAYQRSAVSRAYYAMFCTARDILEGAGDYNPPQCGSQHTYVWNTFGGDPYRAEWVKETRHRLREARRQADYENFIENPSYFAESAVLERLS